MAPDSGAITGGCRSSAMMFAAGGSREVYVDASPDLWSFLQNALTTARTLTGEAAHENEPRSA